MNNVENEEDFNNDLRDIIKAQNGNEDIMEQLIEKNKGLIWSIIRRFKDRGVETDDLYQIGVLGFIKSIKKFDTTFDVKLSTYAVPYIMGEVKRHIRDDGPIKISRSIKDLGKKAMEIQREHLRKNGQDISIVEVAKKLRVSKEEIAFALDSFNPVESIYNSTTDQEDGRARKSLRAQLRQHRRRLRRAEGEKELHLLRHRRRFPRHLERRHLYPDPQLQL